MLYGTSAVLLLNVDRQSVAAIADSHDINIYDIVAYMVTSLCSEICFGKSLDIC